MLRPHERTFLVCVIDFVDFMLLLLLFLKPSLTSNRNEANEMEGVVRERAGDRERERERREGLLMNYIRREKRYVVMANKSLVGVKRNREVFVSEDEKRVCCFGLFSTLVSSHANAETLTHTNTHT